jgi:hypothetical protein
MFDNTNFPWANDLSTDIPTVGDMLRSQGYYTAYIVAMNDLLNLLIESEVGEGVGQMLPSSADTNWALDSSITKLRM